MEHEHIINILITTHNLVYGYEHMELYPIAFKTTAEADYELLCEGYSQTDKKHEYAWEEENIRKVAQLKYTSIG